MIFKTYLFEPFFVKKALNLGKMMKLGFFHTGITEIECFENVFDLQTWQVMQRKSFDKQSRKSGRLSQRTNSVRSLRHWNQKSTWSLQFPLWSRSNAFLKRRNPCKMLTHHFYNWRKFHREVREVFVNIMVEKFQILCLTFIFVPNP